MFLVLNMTREKGRDGKDWENMAKIKEERANDRLCVGTDSLYE